MSSKSPIIRQVAWLSVLPQLALMGFMMWLFAIAGAPNAILFGAFAYVGLSMILRFGISAAHRRGISLFRQKRYAEAGAEFQLSYDFFTRHRWIDDWRFLTLLSSSRVSYREMALLNMAFCHAQEGDGAKAKELYRRALQEFPDSEMAKASLRMIESAEKSAEQDAQGGA